MLSVNLFNIMVLASEAGHSAEGAKPGLMDFDLSLIFYTFLAFVVFLWVMTRFAWKPIVKSLNERADKIEKDIADAKQMREEAEQEKKEYDEKLAAVQAEIEDMRKEGREHGEKIKLQLEDQAKEEAKNIIDRAKREIELEKKAVISELKTSTLENALKIASEVIKRNLTDDDQKKFAEEVFERIDEIKSV